MSPRISTPAALAFATLQCGSGWVSGRPGESIRAANSLQSALFRSATSKPWVRAFSRAGALSSQRIGVAPPACRARAAVRPVRPRPNTATFLPSKPRTGITATPPPLPELEGGQAQQGQDDG